MRIFVKNCKHMPKTINKNMSKEIYYINPEVVTHFNFFKWFTITSLQNVPFNTKYGRNIRFYHQSKIKTCHLLFAKTILLYSQLTENLQKCISLRYKNQKTQQNYKYYYLHSTEISDTYYLILDISILVTYPR